MCLSAEILQFNVKHHAAIDILKPIGGLLALGIIWNVIFTFPICFSMASCQRVLLLFNNISLFYHFRQLKSKFAGPFKISRTVLSHHGDDSIPSLQDIINPPVKHWFMLNALCCVIFGNLDWVQLFKIG